MANYEQKYNKLVEAIKALQEANPSDEGIQNWVHDNVPELAESEDERIRKAIISGMSTLKNNQKKKTFAGISIDDCIDWLERQGEQKASLPIWKYKRDQTPLLSDSLILNKYGCVLKALSGASISDAWVLDYDELAKQYGTTPTMMKSRSFICCHYQDMSTNFSMPCAFAGLIKTLSYDKRVCKIPNRTYRQ